MTIKTITKNFQFEAKVLDEEQRIVRFKISSERIDRDGDIVRQAGIDFSNYSLNPITLYNHARDKELGSGQDWTIVGTETFMDVKFAPAGVSQFIDEKFGLVACGILKSGSIGFIPKEWGWIDLDGKTVFEYRKVELLEFSICTIPANPDAVSDSKCFRDSEKNKKDHEIKNLVAHEELIEFIEIEKLK